MLSDFRIFVLSQELKSHGLYNEVLGLLKSVRDEANKQYDQSSDMKDIAETLAFDALTALVGAGVCTPEEGFLKYPSCLSRSIKDLASERDSARAELERALSSCRVKDDVLAHVRSILKTPVNADIARWASSVGADAELGRMVRNMPRDMKLVPRARASCRYWATFMQFDGGDEADVEFQSPEEALKAAGVTS